MQTQQFDSISQRIANIYWNEGERAAVAERDRINEQERENFSVWFQGPLGGPYLAFFFHDTKFGRELHRTTVWNFRRALQRH
jgi:hypothetical protein